MWSVCSLWGWWEAESQAAMLRGRDEGLNVKITAVSNTSVLFKFWFTHNCATDIQSWAVVFDAWGELGLFWVEVTWLYFNSNITLGIFFAQIESHFSFQVRIPVYIADCFSLQFTRLQKWIDYVAVCEPLGWAGHLKVKLEVFLINGMKIRCDKKKKATHSRHRWTESSTTLWKNSGVQLMVSYCVVYL